jgi:hypothetical protein
MCDPGSLMLASQGASAAGGALSSVFAASSAKRAYRTRAFFNELNADEARGDARASIRRGEFLEQKSRLDTAQLKGRQVAAMGANGVDMTEGSPLARLVSTDYMGETDAITIRQNSTREAASSRARASGYSGQAIMDRASASNINPLLSGVTSLLGSASKVGSDWYMMGKMGAFG